MIPSMSSGVAEMGSQQFLALLIGLPASLLLQNTVIWDNLFTGNV